jgi:hypothetical protein
MASALNAQETPLLAPLLEFADAHLDTEIKVDSALLVVDPMKSYRMDNAAASLDSTLLRESAVNAIGTKFMTRVSEFAEFPAIPRESSISQVKAVSACLNTSNSLMELAQLAHSTQLTAQSPNHVFATKDTS